MAAKDANIDPKKSDSDDDDDEDDSEEENEEEDLESDGEDGNNKHAVAAAATSSATTNEGPTTSGSPAPAASEAKKSGKNPLGAMIGKMKVGFGKLTKLGKKKKPEEENEEGDSATTGDPKSKATTKRSTNVRTFTTNPATAAEQVKGFFVTAYTKMEGHIHMRLADEWTEVWLVLENATLKIAYGVGLLTNEPQYVIDMNTVEAARETTTERPNCFMVLFSGPDESGGKGPLQSHTFQAKDEADKTRWMGTLQGVADACRVKGKMREGTQVVGNAIASTGQAIGSMGKKVIGEMGKLGRTGDRTTSSVGNTSKPSE